jgi:hypothetical protein
MAHDAAELVRLRIGAPKRELLKAARPEAREKVLNSGFFPIMAVLAALMPMALHFLAQWMEFRLRIPYYVAMPILLLLYIPVPISLYRKLIRDACLQILLREGVVLCASCSTDLRRFTWDAALDPVCPECNHPFTRDKLETLTGR